MSEFKNIISQASENRDIASLDYYKKILQWELFELENKKYNLTFFQEWIKDLNSKIEEIKTQIWIIIKAEDEIYS